MVSWLLLMSSNVHTLSFVQTTFCMFALLREKMWSRCFLEVFTQNSNFKNENNTSTTTTTTNKNVQQQQERRGTHWGVRLDQETGRWGGWRRRWGRMSSLFPSFFWNPLHQNTFFDHTLDIHTQLLFTQWCTHMIKPNDPYQIHTMIHHPHDHAFPHTL